MMLRSSLSRCSAGAALTLLLGSVAAYGHDFDSGPHFYAAHTLVSDGGVPADHQDAALQNAWGIAFNPTAVVWIANNGSSTSTLYDGNGNKIPLTVAIPSGKNGPGSPTGIVFSPSTTDFVVSQTTNNVTVSGPARFIFAGEHGTISGWAPNVNQTNAILVHDDDGGAIYKGLAIAQNGTANFLYATDFHNAKVDVFDKTFQKTSITGKFVDPGLPRGYAPFNIQNIQGNLYVTFAKQDADAEDEVDGAGLGFVSVFDSNGNFIRRVTSRGVLNAPWGIAMAPADFGIFSNRLLVANFGDGRINAFDAATGFFVGQFRTSDGHGLKIPGLWGLSFGNGLVNQPTSTLFFTAGPNGEANGAYGRILPAMGDGHDHDGDND
jgi:uncharacterized protein (TIGR03118 family)